MPFTFFGAGNLGGLVNGRGNIDDMSKLRPDLALGLDALRPMNDHAVSRAAKVGRDLLGIGEWRIHRDCPACGKMRICFGTSPFVKMLQHVLDGFRVHR